ncbi:hypothetical protein ACNJYG_06665 [Pseudomonas sp. GW6]
MTTIKPTVGRVLHFIPTAEYAASRSMVFSDPSQPLAATIVYVHSDTMVNLVVMDQVGVPFDVRSVPLAQGDTLAGGSFYAQWMPYQKGQAAKTESLETALQVLDAASTNPLAQQSSDERVRLFLNRGTLVKVNGIPLELEHDAVALVHAANVPLLSPESVAACKSECAD